jgi:hypothetical protein
MSLSLRRISDFDADKVNFAGFGISGTATATTTTNIDYKLTEERLVYGGHAIVKNHAFGDYMALKVVDVDNILGLGAGTVLGTYLSNWYLAEDVQSQPAVMVEYPTKVLANLYLRIAYTSVGNTNVDVKINIFAAKNIT